MRVVAVSTGMMCSLVRLSVKGNTWAWDDESPANDGLMLALIFPPETGGHGYSRKEA